MGIISIEILNSRVKFDAIGYKRMPVGNNNRINLPEYPYCKVEKLFEEGVKRAQIGSKR